MNQEQYNQEREQVDRKFKGMFATTKALKEKGIAALDTSPHPSRIARWINRISLIGGLLLGGWLVFIIVYGLWNYIAELIGVGILILLFQIIYRVGDRFRWWNKSHPY